MNITKLIKQYPNDAELGNTIRKLFNIEITNEEIGKAADENSINYKHKYMSIRSFLDGVEWYAEQLKKSK